MNTFAWFHILSRCMNSVWRCKESRWMYQEAWSTSRKLRTKGWLKLNTLPLAILSTALNYGGIWPYQVCCIGGEMGMAQNGCVDKMDCIFECVWSYWSPFLSVSRLMAESTIPLSILNVSKQEEWGAFVECWVPWGGWSLISRIRLPFSILFWSKLATQMPNLHGKSMEII